MQTAEKIDIFETPMASAPQQNAPILAWLIVLVAGLGYFVDVVDMWLFANFRVRSLQELGLSALEITNTGAFLINCQQAGFLIGGVLWGIMGDKRGRASVMFGSIFLYSVGNILNAYVTNVPQYAALRFITGIGLAGEIGAGITLVCEILPKHQRGIGTTIVTVLGVSGAIVAALMGKYLLWRNAFLIGGIAGLLLLFLRILTHDSGMFQKMKCAEGVKRGSLKMLFSRRESLVRFIGCILVGIPVYLTAGIFAAFAPEIALSLGITEPISVADAFLLCSIGLTIGDLAAGALSQVLQKRKLPLILFVMINAIGSAAILGGLITTATGYTYACGLLGLSAGYWACLLTTSAEQFGTNLRATVTTMIPNVVRATAIPLTGSFIYLKDSFSINQSLWIITAVTFTLTALGLLSLKETFHRDLDFYEK